MAYFQQYNQIIESINPTFDPLVVRLKEIINIIDQLFATQIDYKYGVYPEGFSDWLSTNKTYKTQAFSVTRIVNGEVKEIAYHQFYSKTIAKIVKLLEGAITTLDQIPELSAHKKWWIKYFQVLQNAFLQDNWEEAEKYFLSLPKDSPLLLSIGPIDSYHDKLLGTKRFFSGWVLLKNNSVQEQTLPLWNNVLTIAKNQNSSQAPDTLFLGELLFSGGEVAKQNSMGWSRPENSRLAQESGAVKAIALNKIAQHTERMSIAITSLLKLSNLSDEIRSDLIAFHTDHSLIPLLLHELGHTYDKLPDAHERLGENYQLLEETRANTNMVYLAHLLEKQNKLPKNTALFIFLRVLFYLSYLYKEYTINKQRGEYLFAAVLWFKIAKDNNIIRVESNKIFIDQSHLISTFPHLIEQIRETVNETIAENDRVKIANLKSEMFSYADSLAQKLAF